MPIATPEIYADMLDRAKAGHFAYPAINVTSSQTLNAAIRGFADARSDGIVQVSTGGAEYLSGPTVKHMVNGAVALAEYAHVVAAQFDVQIALHTDHCPKDKLDDFVRPLVAISDSRVRSGGLPLFQSHMWDGSAVPLEENLAIALDLLEQCARAHIIMELEIGVVGGEEDGVENAINDKLYTTPEDAHRTAEVLGLGERGRYMLAATFGNVHRAHKPGNVKRQPRSRRDLQAPAVATHSAPPNPLAPAAHRRHLAVLELDTYSLRTLGEVFIDELRIDVLALETAPPVARALLGLRSELVKRVDSRRDVPWHSCSYS